MGGCRRESCGPAMITPPRKSLYADLAGKDAGVAGLVADDETTLVVHVNGGSGAAVVGDVAAQIDAECLVAFAVGAKPSAS